MDVIAKQAFKMFLGVPAETTNWKARIVKQKDKDNKEYTVEEAFQCSIIFKDNPLGDFVILPSNYQNSLWYSNILCGIIRGSLETVNIKVKANFQKDTMRGDNETEIRVELE